MCLVKNIDSKHQKIVASPRRCIRHSAVQYDPKNSKFCIVLEILKTTPNTKNARVLSNPHFYHTPPKHYHLYPALVSMTSDGCPSFAIHVAHLFGASRWMTSIGSHAKPPLVMERMQNRGLIDSL